MINLQFIFSFVLFELGLLITLSVIAIKEANKKVLDPMEELTKMVNNYKLGIKPKKKKEINSSIDELQNDFYYLIKQIEEEENNKNKIIASISHDVKTPLTSLMGYSERLVDNKKLSEENKNKYYKIINDKAHSLKEIIEEFDDYLSINIKDVYKKEDITIKYLVSYLNDMYKEDLKDKGINFKVLTNISNGIIEVDLNKFKRVFINTINNSIRYLNKEEKNITINIRKLKDNKIKFIIKDNGAGVDNNIDKIFDPFYTTDSSRKISGQGLATCKAIILAHDGVIYAENNKDGGLSVIFILNEKH